MKKIRKIVGGKDLVYFYGTKESAMSSVYWISIKTYGDLFYTTKLLYPNLTVFRRNFVAKKKGNDLRV